MQPSPWLLSKWGSQEGAWEKVVQQEEREREEEERRLEGVRRYVEAILSTGEGEQCTLGGPWLIGAANAGRAQAQPAETSGGHSSPAFLYH